MNKEFLTQVKTANAEEHLKVVLKDVNIANSELNKVLELTKTARQKLESINTDIKDKSIIYMEVCKKTSDKLKEVQTIIDSLDRISNDLDKKRTLIDKELDDKRLLISDLESKFNSNMVYYKNTIMDFETKLDILTSNISQLEKIEKDLLSNIKVSSKETSDLQNEITQMKNKKELIEKEYNCFVISSNKEKEEVQKLIEVEKQKIANPMKLLLSTKSEVERRERDVGILIKRFRREFAKLHPTLNPVI